MALDGPELCERVVGIFLAGIWGGIVFLKYFESLPKVSRKLPCLPRLRVLPQHRCRPRCPPLPRWHRRCRCCRRRRSPRSWTAAAAAAAAVAAAAVAAAERGVVPARRLAASPASPASSVPPSASWPAAPSHAGAWSPPPLPALPGWPPARWQPATGVRCGGRTPAPPAAAGEEGEIPKYWKKLQ